jgi:hypothetical protein
MRIEEALNRLEALRVKLDEEGLYIRAEYLNFQIKSLRKTQRAFLDELDAVYRRVKVRG